jgi:tRNA 2-selenouridine synthase
MPGVLTVADAEPATLADFDVIVDARSPAEFAVDHIPGAINLPVLSDAERAEIGTIYVHDSRFKARRLGGALVARNVARHLETIMVDWSPAQRPLVYCWRGGMRSGAMAVILSQVGWRTSVLEGGYRTYRRRVSARLYGEAPPARLVLLEGCTGTGKTEILQRLADRGVQTIDLEGLAAHRGSLFGALHDRAQPSQKLFESRLLAALEGLDPARPVVVEAESSKIGELILPPAVWSAMTAAPRVAVAAPADERARYLAATYADIVADADRLAEALARLPDRPGRKRLEAWKKLASDGAWRELAAALIEAHYDPAYRRSAKRDGRPRLATIEIEALDAAGLNRAAEHIAALLASVAAMA